LAQLAACEAPEAAEALRRLAALAPHWTDQEVFFRSRNVASDGREAVLREAGMLSIGGLVITPAAFDWLRDRLIDALSDRHRSAPDEPGLQPERLRLLLAERPSEPDFQSIVEAVVRSGAIVRDGPWLRLPGHTVVLSAPDRRLWDRVVPLLMQDRFRPPRIRDLAKALGAPEPAMRALLKRAQRMGFVVEVAPDRFYPREVVAEMLGIAAQMAGAAEGLTAAVFRDRLNIGRNVAIQILEFFDRSGVTVRACDLRRVRADRVGTFGVGQVGESGDDQKE